MTSADILGKYRSCLFLPVSFSTTHQELHKISDLLSCSALVSVARMPAQLGTSCQWEEVDHLEAGPFQHHCHLLLQLHGTSEELPIP